MNTSGPSLRLSVLRDVRCWLMLALTMSLAALGRAQIYTVPTITAPPITGQIPYGGGVANGVGVADMDGNGTDDLVYVTVPSGSGSTSYVEVMLRQVNGTSTTVNTAIPTACNAVSYLPRLFVGNFVGSGHPDVGLTCATNQFVVLPGKGDGTFGSPIYSTLPVGASLSTLQVADFNGDGLLDVLTTANAGISVQKNNGSGSFTTAVTTTFSGSLGGQLIVGDFNGDGKKDLVFNTSGGGTNTTVIEFLPGKGDGTFGTMAVATGTIPSTSYFVADINGDGLSDVLYSVPDANGYYTLYAALGSANGPVIPQSGIPYGLAGLGSVYMADVNGDGVTDLILFPEQEMLVIPGKSAGSFGTPKGYALLTENATTYALKRSATGPVDFIGLDERGTEYLRNNGDGTFPLPPATDLPAAALGTLPSLGANFLGADLNNDGYTDAAGSPAYLSTGDGRFAATATASAAGPTTTLDWNKDGKLDTAVVASANTVALYTGNGDGTSTLKSTTTVTLPTGASLNGIVSGDFDGDGKVDLVVSYGAYIPYKYGSTLPGGVFLLRGNGDGTFQPAAAIADGPIQSPTNMLVADLNKDGRSDLLIADGSNVAVLLGQANGTLTFATPTVAGSASVLSNAGGSIGLGDFFKTGKLNLVAGGNVIQMFAGNNDGTFSSTGTALGTLLEYGQPSGNLLVGDVDNDGYLDIAVFSTGSSSAMRLTVFRGSAAGTFDATNTYSLGYADASITALRPINGFLGRMNGKSSGPLDFAYVALGRITTLLNNQVKATSTVALTASSLTPTSGAGVTLTATVTGTTPTGTVTFSSGTTTLGTGTITAGVATLATTFTTVGPASVTATYAGDTSNAGATSTALALTVKSIATSVTLTSSVAAPFVAQSFTLTATVSAGSTGTVTFLNGTATLGTGTIANGVATFATQFAVAGSYSISASYGGDTTHAASTSSAVIFTVVAPDFSFSGTPALVTLSRGQAANYTLSLASVGGFAGNITFSCGALPSEAACSFTPATVIMTSQAAATAQLTVSTTAAHSSALSTTRLAALLPFGLLGLGLLRKRRLRRLVVLILVLAGLGLAQGCSDGTTKATDAGTPSGSTTVMVTATSGATTHTTSVTLTVQ